MKPAISRALVSNPQVSNCGARLLYVGYMRW
jgi:hypothetical protein